MPQDEDDVSLDPTLDFVAGTIAGMAALVVGHPFDTVKVRFQMSETAGRYSGTWNAIRTITREESLRGLYKGVTSPLAGAAFLNGMVFASYGFFIRAQLKNKYDEPTIAQMTLAGAGTGVAASLITTPMELVKIRQQTSLVTSGRPTTLQVAQSIFRKQGIRGLYRGITSTALRDIGYGMYFGTYEATCRYLGTKPSPKQPVTSILSTPDSPDHRTDHTSLLNEMESMEQALSWPKLMFAGGLAGVVGWISTFPMDPIKSRMQGTDWKSPSAPGPPNPYNNTYSAIRQTLKELGHRGLWAGLTPTLVRYGTELTGQVDADLILGTGAIPVNMATFLVFEMVVSTARG